MDKKIIIGLTLIVMSIAGFVSYLQYQAENKYKGLLICSKIGDFDNNATYSNLLNIDKTKEFYTKHCQNSKMLAWFDNELKLDEKNANGLLEAIKLSNSHGFFAEKYHTKQLQEEISKYTSTVEWQTPAQQTSIANKLDVLLSDAYIALFDDSYYGLTDWKKFRNLQKEYAIAAARKIEEEKRQKLIESNATVVEVEEEAVRKFEWEAPTKNNLIASNELLVSLGKHNILDSLKNLHPTLKEYERLVKMLEKHRMTNNKEQIGKILVNMERFRWITTNYDALPKAVNINIPSFHLNMLENGEDVLSMRVIVGKPQRPTPILESSLSYATLNPYWTAPNTIVTQDIMKKKADHNMSGYLTSHNMKVFNLDKKEINPKDVNWSMYKGKKSVPYVFRAEPGKDNPLGAVKFTFPNKYSVYMHDTDKKEFFAHEYRAFSSGCVRLSEPLKLLGYFLNSDDVNLTKLNKQNKPEYGLSLKDNIPVIFRYMTLKVDKDMNIHTYEDIYGYDETNLHAIRDIEKIIN